VIDGLRPYADLVATGLPWLPSLPAHWDVRRNGRLFGERRETGYPDLSVLEVSIRTGVRVRDFESGTRKQEIADRSKYQRAVQGDIAYNMMRMWQGAVGIAPADGLVSPAYVVAKPFAEVDAGYYAYLFRTDGYKHEIDAFSRGIVPDRNRLYWEAFKQMPSAYPPLEEQRLIVRFLDWHGGMAARLIRAKKRLIALLNEQKQSIIHHAVTRGLDPTAPLKPSGVDWLGDVPEGWEVLPLKRLASFKSGAGFPVGEQGGKGLEIPFLKVSDMNISGNERYIRSWNNSISRESAIDLGAYIFPEKAIIFPKVGGAMLTNKRRLLQQESCIDNNVMGCVANNCDLNFLFLSLEKIDLGKISKPGPVPAIGEGEVREIRIAVPPIEEQRQIADWLRQATGDLERSIETILSEITLIQEFRTRLIADVVTGQLDVRALAATLPAVTDAAPLDDLIDGDEADEDAEAHEPEEADA
jgi:type I restriction enzyme, S subunit